jgi:hypothetical protein
MRKVPLGEGTQRGRSLFDDWPNNAGKARSGSSQPLNGKKARGSNQMNYHALFAALCVAIAVNILVAVIAIIRAYREEKRIRHLPAWPRMGRSLHFERR